MDLSKQELDIIFNYIVENDNIDIDEIFNLSNNVMCFFTDIYYYTEDDIYQLFKNKNPLVVFIPNYRTDINYFKAITYLYFKDYVNTIDNKGLILTLKLKKIYNHLSENINTILNSNKDIEKVVDYIIKFDDVELFKFYNYIDNNKCIVYTAILTSYTINILQYVITYYKDDFKNYLSKEYNDFIYSDNVLLILLDNYDIYDIIDCIDFLNALKYFINIYNDNLVLKILDIVGIEHDMIIDIVLDVKILQKYIFLPKSFKFIIKNLDLDYHSFKLIYSEIKNMDDTFNYNKNIILNILYKKYPKFVNKYLKELNIKNINIRHSL